MPEGAASVARARREYGSGFLDREGRILIPVDLEANDKLLEEVKSMSKYEGMQRLADRYMGYAGKSNLIVKEYCRGGEL